MSELTAAQRVKIARTLGRPGTLDFVNALFTDVFVCKGDRLHREDPSIFGAIARFHGRPVTVLGHRKGRTFEENMKCNFGMPSPEGYRKAQRLMRQAEKFGRPIFTFIDTPGAYPGLEAEPLTSGILLSKCHAGADSGASAAVTVPGPFSGGAVSWALSGRSPAFEHSPGFGADSGAWYAASVP